MADDAGDRLWDPTASARHHAHVHLKRICAALGKADVAGPCEVMDVLTENWGERGVREAGFGALLTLDTSPLEFSITSIGDVTRLRWLVQLAPGNTYKEVLQLVSDLERRYGAQAERVRRLAGAFVARPDDKSEAHAIGVDFHKRPLFKLYSRSLRPEFASETLVALGLRQHADWLYEWMRPSEQVNGVSVDLLEGERVKIYLEHKTDVARRIEELGAKGARHRKGEFVEFVSAVTGAPKDQLDGYRVFTAVNLIEQTQELDRLACHVYFNRKILGGPDGELVSDAVFMQRVQGLYEKYGIPADTYRRAVHAFARTELEHEYMIHSDVGYQALDVGPSLSVYLNSRMRAYDIGIQ